jgi:MOSC domain-containing protein YiiM
MSRGNEAGTVTAVCISGEKGVPKRSVSSAALREGHGIVGDAHAGPWHRQVSLLSGESIDRMREILPELGDGAFAENIVTRGIDLGRLRVGSRLEFGSRIRLEVTQIGKECHGACAIRRKVGDCIMPTEGLFCRVIRGGTVRPGDAIVAKPAEKRSG